MLARTRFSSHEKLGLLTDHCLQYSKSLGSGRPKSVVRLESVIWKEIMDMACGVTDVFAAARTISDAIPGILKDVEPGDESWFDLGTSSVNCQLFTINYLPS